MFIARQEEKKNFAFRHLHRSFTCVNTIANVSLSETVYFSNHSYPQKNASPVSDAWVLGIFRTDAEVSIHNCLPNSAKHKGVSTLFLWKNAVGNRVQKYKE